MNGQNRPCTFSDNIANQLAVSGVSCQSHNIFLISFQSRYFQLMVVVGDLLSSPREVVVTETGLDVATIGIPGKDSVPSNLFNKKYLSICKFLSLREIKNSTTCFSLTLFPNFQGSPFFFRVSEEEGSPSKIWIPEKGGRPLKIRKKS